VGLDPLLEAISSALRIWIRKRQPLPTWQAPSGSDPIWTNHINRLNIPLHRGKPSLLLDGIGDSKWLRHEPGIGERVDNLFTEGIDALRIFLSAYLFPFLWFTFMQTFNQHLGVRKDQAPVRGTSSQLGLLYFVCR
jgi:hypothetical protein